MMHILKPFQCSSCNAGFSNKDFGRQYFQTKFPYILPCNHSVCESCLNHAIKSQTDFICPVCKVEVDLPSGTGALNKFLPDLHSLGILNANRNLSMPSICWWSFEDWFYFLAITFSIIYFCVSWLIDYLATILYKLCSKYRCIPIIFHPLCEFIDILKVKMLSSPEVIQSLRSNAVSKTAAKLCDMCHQMEALWQCDECQSNFCSLCFDQVHKKIKSKKKHEVKKIFAEQYNTVVQTGCPDHKNKSVEFYCEKDDKLTCSHCMLIGDHIGHEVKTLVDKNKSCAEDLKNLLVDISGVEKRLRYTEHLLSEVSATEKIDISEHVSTIHNHFHKLHSLLQTREMELISELEKVAGMQNEPFVKMAFEISGYQKDIMSIKRDAESVIENPCLAISAPYLLTKLGSFKDIPCYLLPIEANMDKKVKIDLLLNEDLEDVLKNHGTVDSTVKPRFHLVPTQDLPENYCMEIPESFAPSDLESQSNTTHDSYSEDSLMAPSTSKSGIEAAFKFRDHNRSCPEAVHVTFIKDPSSFYVQRCAEIKKLSALSDAINKWCRHRNAQVDQHISIETGDLYLVQSSTDRKWHRGRIMKILEPGDTYEITMGVTKLTGPITQKRTVQSDELKVEVFYIDYGLTEVVPVPKLKNIQARFLSYPGMAKHCSLVDISPKNSTTWSDEAIESFTKFVNQKQVIMQIYEERNNVYNVDLSQVPDNNVTNDVPVSVRDALVFQELAVFPSGKILPPRRPSVETPFLPPERLKINVTISVIVSHVDSPSHFYVQQISTASYLSALIFEMSDAYSRDNNALLHSIYAPRVGMVCAAQFSVDKQWYRAQVISLPGGSSVEVQYVDFGNTEIIHHSRIRKLFNKFSKLNIQAIPCKLADVTYNQEKCWSTEAKEWLTKKVSKKQLTLKSMGFDAADKKSDVLLYFVEHEYELCVNTLIVEAGLASSCGCGSKTLRKRIERPPTPEPLVSSLDSELRKVMSFESLEDLPLSPTIIPAPVEKSSVPSLVKKFPDEGHHIEVHISHIISPSVFYVRIAGEMEKKLEKLMNEMQKAYEHFDGIVEDCNVGKSYAVYCEKQKKWFRGTVLTKVDADNVKVSLVDYGSVEMVPTKNLQKLLEKFTKDEEYSISCELTGIVPAGGSSWSFAACDAFQELVSPHEILHLTCKIKIDKETKSLPVTLYIEEIKLGGALEATEVIYENVASQLVSLGLAIPVRNSETQKSPSKSPEKSVPESTEVNNEVEKKCLIPGECEVDPVFIKSPVKERNISNYELLSDPPFQWKPVEYPNESKFKGFVTNIGEDGSIQLHVFREGGSLVEMIKRALQFHATKPAKPAVKKNLKVGQACMAKFPLDKLWYRAEIIAVYPEQVKVNFVDYGNNEIVQAADIRTDVIMQPYSRQCLECKIVGIHTGEPDQWDEGLLNFLHSQLVESIVEVEVLGPPDANGKLPCDMVTNCGVSVKDLLNNMGFLDSNTATRKRRRTFHKATELREGDVFPVCITQINSPSIVYLQRLKISEPKSDYEKESNKEHDAFLELIQELQEKAESFPKVEDPEPGMACCAQYSYDNNWYRCEVTEVSDEEVTVLYVDYGNSETIPIENLRDPDSHIIDFPVQVLFCKIHGMSPVGDEWNPEVKKFMIEKLLGSGLEVFAKVVIPDKISHVDLMVKDENEEMKLAYEELVDMNLITLNRN